MADIPARSTRRALDERALAQVLRRLRAAPRPPWLHAEVARRMAERLPIVKLQPDVVCDWGARLGASADVLRQAYPRARIVAVEHEAPAVAPAPWWSLRRAAPAVVAEDAVEPGAAQLVWANMTLQGSIDPQQTMERWQRALAVDGFLMFSTLGPGTFERLGAIYREHGWPPPFAPFVDMHDLGDMLVHAGFADPVMDQETLALTWADAPALLAELRTLGGNVDPARHAALRTPRWRRRLLDALAASAGADGRPALQVELVYGHAFKPPPRARMAATTAVPLDDLRAMVRTRRPGR